MTALETLAVALADLADVRILPPRAGRDAWLSEDAEQRARAAQRCPGCPVLNQCTDAATENRERFGVWGGVDRTPKPIKRRTPA